MKNIILCMDGTGDWAGSGRTNVVKIYDVLKKDENQVCFYDGGVGTLSDASRLTTKSRMFTRLLDAAVANGLQQKLRNAYEFLIDNYEEGDQIYLFGFSRGSYTARLLASMLMNYGLLKKGDAHLIPYLWQSTANVTDIGAFKHEANRLKKMFDTRTVEVWFMGLFDTVSSVGILERFAVHPNTDRNKMVRRVCHAVSIDEQRNAFPESLMHPGQEGLTEVWFPGVHRDTGGGFDDAKCERIADEALHWIAFEADMAGVRFDTLPPKPDASRPYVLNYPDVDPYVFLGLYPMRMFNKRVSEHRVLWPNFRHLRTIPEFSLIHESAFALKESERSTYAPYNWPRNPVPFKVGDPTAAPKRYVLKDVGFNAADAIGIPFGVMMLFLLWNLLSGSPMGDSWPNLYGLGLSTATWTWLLGTAFIASLVLGQKYTDRLPGKLRIRAEGALPYVGLVIGASVVVAFLNWTLMLFGFGIGLVWLFISQFPGWPVLQTDRSLPYMLYAMLAALGAKLAYPLLVGVSEAISRNLSFMPSLPRLNAGDMGLLSIAFFVLAALLSAFALLQDRLTIKRKDQETLLLNKKNQLRPNEVAKEALPTLPEARYGEREVAQVTLAS